MRSNHKRIGDFIELVDERNKDLSVTKLLGLSITKEFIPSVANTIGTNMANYKIIKKNQFACSVMQVRRDKKMPVALLRDFDEAIISQAYPVFEVLNESELFPDYLMMWFSRSEFDRHACFLAVGGVRGSLEWDDFLDMELPIPSIEKQRAIVKEYNTIVNRIKLNEELNKKLEETAQALYKQWFVDFEFPNENGQPYKSSGGKMVSLAELDQEIPVDFQLLKINKLTKTVLGGTPSRLKNEFWGGNIPWINSGKVNDLRITTPAEYITIEGLENSSTKLLPKNTVVLAITGATLGQVSIVEINTCANQSVIGVLETDKLPFEFLYLSINHFINELLKSQTGGAQPHINKDDVNNLNIIYPNKKTILLFKDMTKPIFKLISNNCLENDMLLKMKELLLSKMTTVESLQTSHAL